MTLSHSPASEPSTTTSSAPNSTFTPRRWNRGSTPLTAADVEAGGQPAVAIQKMPICRCHVRVTVYGRYFASGMP